MVTLETLPAIEWRADDAFRVEDVSFRIADAGQSASSGRDFVLVKTRDMVERYERLIDSLRPRNVLELGIYEGGSAAFLALRGRPTKLVALDLKTEPSVGLEQFITGRGLQDRVRTHYSFDQADAARLRRLVAEEFGVAPIDLVIDDASHSLEPTRASFNTLFPRVRPGGVFVIEDWSKVHKLDAAFAARARVDVDFRERLAEHVGSDRVTEAPLSLLLLELVVASAYAPELIAEIVIADGWAQVVRGDGQVDPDRFDVRGLYTDAAGRVIARTP
jgi:predicted O-methyltransferase YrrM